MAFETLICVIRNYLRHGYSNIIIDDLQDHRVQQIANVLHDVPVQIVTLVLSDTSELRRRISSRKDGWKDAEAAVAWNQRVMARACVNHERKIDVTGKSPLAVFAEVLKILNVDGV